MWLSIRPAPSPPPTWPSCHRPSAALAPGGPAENDNAAPGMTFVDAVPLEVLTRCKRVLEAHDRSLVLRAPSRATRILLDVHGLVDLVEPEK